MQLTTKGRYAVTAMLDVGMYGDGSPVKLADISQRQDISISYLEQLFSKLRRGVLVCSIKGPGGGYVLSRAAEDISVAEVINAVDEKLDVTSCGGHGNCFNGEQCMTHQLWDDLSNHMKSFLASVSLASLISKQQAKDKDDDIQVLEIKDFAGMNKNLTKEANKDFRIKS